MCPALNSKPYGSNKQVVPLLGCCSDAPGSPGNRNLLRKNCCNFATLRDLKSDHLMHPSYQVWACIAPDSHATANRQTFFSKNRYIWPKITFFCKFGFDFCSEIPLHIWNALFWNQASFWIKTCTDDALPRYPQRPTSILSTKVEHAWMSGLFNRTWKI